MHTDSFVSVYKGMVGNQIEPNAGTFFFFCCARTESKNKGYGTLLKFSQKEWEAYDTSH